jgi:hypothetical protein
MPFSAIAKQDNFQQTGPAKAVDVIHLDRCLQQQLHCHDMALLARRDQRIAAEPIADAQIG